MSGKPRILLTGFGPFPGAPFNPTMPLVKRLTALRRPAFRAATDEAPLLATYSFLPIIAAYAKTAGVDVEIKI